MHALLASSRIARVVIRLLLCVGLSSPALRPNAGPAGRVAETKPVYRAELVFPPESWHNHASCVVETPRGDLWVCWFHGSGERTADDVKIEGARWRRGARGWSPRFTLADTPGYPDTNPALFIDPEGRLWLLWPTILANRWESALMKYRISADYHRDGPPRWQVSENLHVTPGPEFEAEVNRRLPDLEAQVRGLSLSETERREANEFLDAMRQHAGDKLYRRLGWMTRAHPFVLDGRRIIVPLYHDGFSFSLMAITEDGGATWHVSAPLVGGGNIQPSIVRRTDGSLYTLMRDNGPPPKRLLEAESRDRGETWSAVVDSVIPNPGSGAELLALRNGHWLCVGNDTESGRHRLAVWMSADEGRTWPWRRALEEDPPGPEAGSYSYPSVLEARDGSIHVTYSWHRSRPRAGTGEPAGKSIKHARFNEAWIRFGLYPGPEAR
ncbi:MAG TPA: exo-alpha-sialidase [Verrucomicrobiota bacterium]|nr:exo-alpha-sialidase [Verrucomicrobiota bacterium]HNU49410.1 exo-alpha-sialidase [Verrucomicrobiota bacterium]